MKSRLLFSFSIIFLVSIFFSCNKDKDPPVITVVGFNPVSHCIGSDYIDEGATAVDEEDGDISDKINTVINVNTDVEGSYTVLYTVEDNSGNSATATRTVNVIYCK